MEVLFKAEKCPPCVKLSTWLDASRIEVSCKVVTFEDLRSGEYPFDVVPSLVKDDGSVISGFPQIRLYLSKRNN